MLKEFLTVLRNGLAYQKKNQGPKANLDSTVLWFFYSNRVQHISKQIQMQRKTWTHDETYGQTNGKRDGQKDILTDGQKGKIDRWTDRDTDIEADEYRKIEQQKERQTYR
jgi:hypothetical protein